MLKRIQQNGGLMFQPTMPQNFTKHSLQELRGSVRTLGQAQKRPLEETCGSVADETEELIGSPDLCY